MNKKYCFALWIFLIHLPGSISVQSANNKSTTTTTTTVALSSCTSDGDCPEKHKCCTRVESRVCLPVQVEHSDVNLNENYSKQAAVVDRVCPDGEKPLKNCYTVRCPYGYYCFYGLCCKHSKAGLCPAAVAGGGEPAGPSCDNDMECPWILKCCVINGNNRCLFPFNYVGGTVGILWPTVTKLRQSNQMKL
ncbi:Uromodulin-like [Trichinella spiralis]|uniref:Uromodulin-like n=1 Tax=Trichinella spiralis TaxID=6334 RepID=A0ABR3KLT4_TRISP